MVIDDKPRTATIRSQIETAEERFRTDSAQYRLRITLFRRRSVQRYTGPGDMGSNSFLYTLRHISNYSIERAIQRPTLQMLEHHSVILHRHSGHRVDPTKNQCHQLRGLGCIILFEPHFRAQLMCKEPSLQIVMRGCGVVHGLWQIFDNGDTAKV